MMCSEYEYVHWDGNYAITIASTICMYLQKINGKSDVSRFKQISLMLREYRKEIWNKVHVINE